MRILPPLVLLFAAAACVPQPVAPPSVAPPAPVVRAAPPAAVATGDDWRDWPLTPGTWSYRRDDRGSTALFGPAGGDARLTLRCDLDRRQIVLSIAGDAAAPVTVRTSSTTRAVPVQPTGGTPPYTAATLAADDPLLDAMGFSRGRFVVARPGAQPLVVPAWAEIERVTEDCRG